VFHTVSFLPLSALEKQQSGTLSLKQSHEKYYSQGYYSTRGGTEGYFKVSRSLWHDTVFMTFNFGTIDPDLGTTDPIDRCCTANSIE